MLRVFPCVFYCDLEHARWYTVFSAGGGRLRKDPLKLDGPTSRSVQQAVFILLPFSELTCQTLHAHRRKQNCQAANCCLDWSLEISATLFCILPVLAGTFPCHNWQSDPCDYPFLSILAPTTVLEEFPFSFTSQQFITFAALHFIEVALPSATLLVAWNL